LTVVDLMPLLYRFTMDVSTEFLFGSSVNSQTMALHSLESGNPTEAREEADFAWAMNFAQDFIAGRMRLGPLFWLKTSADFKRACAIVKAFTGRFVALALDPTYKKPASFEGKFVLLDALVAETRDAVELRDQIVQILLAGRDTTSALLCWTILLLARNPEVYASLRESVISHFGHGEQPTFTSLKACKSLTHVLYETLRLYPIVPLNSRTAVRDTVLPTGGGPDFNQPITVRKGESVGYSAYVLHRRHDIWGKDADEFRPERWEGRKLGWEMIPFSGGARVCIGRKLALFSCL
jgi:cytochrome P450